MRARTIVLGVALAATAIAPVLPSVSHASKAKPGHAVAATATASSGSVDRSHIPDGGPPPKLVVPKPARFKLSTGTEVLVVERHELPMASVSVVWPRGAGDELPSQAGLASLTASLLDEGTKKHGSIELAEAVEGIGAQLGSGSAWDYTAVSLTTLKKHFGDALGLLAEVVTEPAFDGKELERVRAETLTGLLQRRDVPSIIASDVFARTLYGDGLRYGLPAVGTEETIKRFTRDDVVGWYERELTPKAATIIVAGDVTPSEARAALEKAFAGWKSESKGSLNALVTEPDPPRAHRVLVDKAGAPQSEIRLGLPSVPRRSPDYFPMLVMNEILGGGEFSNRLNMNLREAHAYTYGAHSAIAFRRDGGPFVAAAATKTAVTGAAMMEAFSELLRIRTAPVDPKELRLAKDGLERAMARRFATLSDVTSELASQVLYGLPDDFFSTFAKKVEAVTADDVMRVAKEHLDPAKLSMVIVGDRQSVEEQLKASPLGAFDEVDGDGHLITAKITPLPAGGAPQKTAAPAAPQHK